MGIYLNPNNENFRRTLAARIYVDKTLMISRINDFIDEGNNYICVSRPRRFGKTIASEMLSAYYSKGCDSRAMFSGLEIGRSEEFGKNLNGLNVIKIDLNSEYNMEFDKTQLIRSMTKRIVREVAREFPEAGLSGDESLPLAILNVYEHDENQQFVIIIDEYDVLIREQADKIIFDEYLSLLNGLFKSATLRPAIALAYITGILPVIRDRVQSKLNNFEEYTILEARELAEYIGFIDDEVKELCDNHGMEYTEVKSWYDGYRQHGFEIYNPQSVVRSLTDKRCKSYWSMTSTYQVIAERLRDNFKGTRDAVIRMMAGESVDVNVDFFMNTMKDFDTLDDVFTYLIHIGYLAYNEEDETCRIPNREIWREWEYAVSVVDEYETTDKIISASKELLQATFDGDEEAVAKALDESHIHVTSNRSYNNEDALQSAIYLAYLYAINKYTIIREATSGKGFADVVYVPLKPTEPAMIIELKRNDCADSAINQIKEKKYFDSLGHYKGNLLFVGINYDEKDKTHTCRIKQYVKQ